MIAPLKDADVDVFVVLDPKYYDAGNPAGLLDRVKRVLRKTYPSTPDISRNGQAVTIRFSDFRADIVPGFYRQAGGYLIPNSQMGSWIPTDPKRHAQLSADHNKKQNGQLIPVEKMLKCWNRTHAGFFRSFHLEVLAWELFSGTMISNDWSGIRWFFEHAAQKVKCKNPDPAGYGEDVGYYIPTKDEAAAVSERLSKAGAAARRAEALAQHGDDAGSIKAWRTILGEPFPAYG